jgi:malonate-semialdehyde dehydrogenase (acetylating) / methylmalonate-semialdehyde dehydrogenase
MIPLSFLPYAITTSCSAARKFHNAVLTGNVGVNIGVPAPMAYFPFSG